MKKIMYILTFLFCVMFMENINAKEITCKYEIDKEGFPYTTLTVGYSNNKSALQQFKIVEDMYIDFPLYYQFDNGTKYWNEYESEARLRDINITDVNKQYVNYRNGIDLDKWITSGCYEQIYIYYNSDFSTLVFSDEAAGRFANFSIGEGSKTNSAFPIKLTSNSEKGQVYEVTIKYNDGTTFKKYKAYAGDKITKPLETETGLPEKNDAGESLCWFNHSTNKCWKFDKDVINSDVSIQEVYFDKSLGDNAERYFDENNYGIGFLDLKDKEVMCNGHSIPYGVPYIIYRIINIIKILTPIILIILGLIDYTKAVIAGHEDEMKKSTAKFIKRAIAAVIVFFVIAIVQFVFNILGNNDAFSCFSCFVSGEDCNIVVKEKS